MILCFQLFKKSWHDEILLGFLGGAAGAVVGGVVGAMAGSAGRAAGMLAGGLLGAAAAISYGRKLDIVGI
jgi:hypothetical protein